MRMATSPQPNYANAATESPSWPPSAAIPGNLSPQAGDLNSGQGSRWRAMEEDWADALRSGSGVSFDVRKVYKVATPG